MELLDHLKILINCHPTAEMMVSLDTRLNWQKTPDCDPINMIHSLQCAVQIFTLFQDCVQFNFFYLPVINQNSLHKWLYFARDLYKLIICSRAVWIRELSHNCVENIICFCTKRKCLLDPLTINLLILLLNWMFHCWPCIHR